MVEQVEELKPELQLGLLTQLGQAPVFVKGKVHISGVRAMALSRIAKRPLAEDISVHSEGLRVDVLQVVSGEAGLTSHQWTNAEIRQGAITHSSPRVPGDGYAAVWTGRSARQTDAGDAVWRASQSTRNS